jgi:hypothetical protein
MSAIWNRDVWCLALPLRGVVILSIAGVRAEGSTDHRSPPRSQGPIRHKAECPVASGCPHRPSSHTCQKCTRFGSPRRPGLGGSRNLARCARDCFQALPIHRSCDVDLCRSPVSLSVSDRTGCPLSAAGIRSGQANSVNDSLEAAIRPLQQDALPSLRQDLNHLRKAAQEVQSTWYAPEHVRSKLRRQSLANLLIRLSSAMNLKTGNPQGFQGSNP